MSGIGAKVQNEEIVFAMNDVGENWLSTFRIIVSDEWHTSYKNFDLNK